jgi:hypothetical protein
MVDGYGQSTQQSLSGNAHDVAHNAAQQALQHIQSSIFSTGSISGFHSLGPLGQGYLTASEHAHNFCGNAEGWGPLSRYRYDFTPCFLDVWVGSVAAFGIVGGALAIWYLVKRRNSQSVEKDWHFWVKQVRGPGGGGHGCVA